MKVRSSKVSDIDGFGSMRFYTAPHDDIKLWGFYDDPDKCEVGHESADVLDGVVIAFRQTGERPFVIYVSREDLTAAAREIGL